MYREGSRLPIGRGGMTHGTIGRQIEGRVVGICRGIVIGLVAPIAGVRRICIVTIMANITIVRNSKVGTGKWIDGAVIECRRHPGRLRMADRTIGWELLGLVIGVGRLVIIREVATNTSGWRIIVIAVVAGDAVVGNGSVRAIEGPK